MDKSRIGTIQVLISMGASDEELLSYNYTPLEISIARDKNKTLISMGEDKFAKLALILLEHKEYNLLHDACIDIDVRDYLYEVYDIKTGKPIKVEN